MTDDKTINERLKGKVRYYKLLLRRAKKEENKRVYKLVLHELERCLYD